MATYNQLIYDMLEDLKRYSVSSQVDISPRQIIFKYDKQRALWLEREMSGASSGIASKYVSRIGCMELTLGNPIDCCLDADCKILMTVKKIPRFLNYQKKPAITGIFLAGDYKERIPLVEFERLPYISEGKYKVKKPIAFINGEHLFIMPTGIEHMLLESVYVQGVVADTLQLEDYNTCDNGECFSYDDQYPFDESKLAYVRDYVLKEFVGGIQMPTDKTNDSRDRLEQI
jgi:hypothetical protein